MEILILRKYFILGIFFKENAYILREVFSKNIGNIGYSLLAINTLACPDFGEIQCS